MKTRTPLIVAITLSVSVGGIALLSGPAAEALWPSLGGSFQRAGLSPSRGPLTGAVQWKFVTGGAVVSSLTVGFDGRIHVACEDGTLYTLKKTGQPIWVLDVQAPLVSAPTIGPDGGLYVGAKDGRLFALDPNGSPRWACTTGDAIYSSPAVGSDGNVYVGSADGRLYALDPNGAPRWQFRTWGPGVANGAVFASPSLAADGTVYVAGLYDPNLYALNPADGSVKWVCCFATDPNDPTSGGWPFASPVVAPDGTIYETLLYDTHLYAIEPADGTIRWSVDLCEPSLFSPEQAALLDGDGWSEPVVGPDGTIYVSLDDPYLRAVDPSGILKWVAELGEASALPPNPYGAGQMGAFTLTVDRAGMIYAAADDGHVYVVSPGSLVVAQFEPGGWPGFPVIADDDLLILADSKDYSSLNSGEKNAVWAISSQSLAPATR
jgi:outer membrane protein assembly factor BamB